MPPFKTTYACTYYVLYVVYMHTLTVMTIAKNKIHLSNHRYSLLVEKFKSLWYLILA